VDTGQREGLNISEREQLKALQREVKELRRANDILKTASAFFAQASASSRKLNSCRTLSINTATRTGSSRSARSCRLPRRVTDATQPKCATQPCAAHEPTMMTL
jgi:hypothetical protein